MSDFEESATKVVRISMSNYKRLNGLKKAMAKKQGIQKMTYDPLLAEALNVAEVLLAGEEVFYWQGEIFTDVSGWIFPVA